jgi:hypothetical protein
MSQTIRTNRLTLAVFTIALTLVFTQLPSTDSKAVTACLGPAAYPPDLPDCLDPVEEANRQATIKAAADKAAAVPPTESGTSPTQATPTGTNLISG